ncbi:MAG: bifunctional metallophosphatase/5'-nucleotidase [Proteobacteria bacterium]|nr:bifunctional metallophosphatase/5'-nucleotidase [Pseudomonadota bacterium]
MICRIFLVLFPVLVGCATESVITDPLADQTLTFIHLNDTYRVDAVEEGKRGGFSRVATLVRELKAQGRDVRILHGGDFLYPSLESQLWNGEQMVEAMNFLDDLAPMYVVPGNHEFDPRSADEVMQRIRESRFEWLGDNFHLATGDKDIDDRLRSAFTFKFGERKIGIFALTVDANDGGNARDYTPFEEGYVEHAERVIQQFEAEGADLVFGLTHLYLSDDIVLAKLREHHPKFQFIAGGHEHEPEFVQGDTKNAMIMKGASNARTIWQIDVQFVNGVPDVRSRQIAVDESIEPDDEYQVIATKWRSKLLELVPFLPSRIGDAAESFDGREVAIRSGDTNWGMFIADQMRTAFGTPIADFALVNGGTLRIDDFIAEDITFEDIGRTFGFSSYLRYMTMDGRDFREMIEAGYRGLGPSKGYFPQISGFRVCVDRDRPDGERIVQMQIPVDGAWQDIDPGKAYKVIAPDFIYRGGDGYDFSKARDVSRPGSELKYLVLDAVIRAQADGQKVGADLDAPGSRFALLHAGADTCF